MQKNLNYPFIMAFVLLITSVCLYFLRDVLQPFIFGAIMAYFLDPIADKMVKYKIPRPIAASVLIILSLSMVSIFAIFVLPLFLEQFRHLILILPNLYEWLSNFGKAWWESFVGEEIKFNDAMQSIRNEIQDNLGTVLESFFASSIALVKFFTNTLITIVLAFYLLLDWDRLVGFIAKLMPRRYHETWEMLFVRIDAVLASFFRGQILVCSILALYYGVSLMLVGLDTGLVLGLFAGLISFIPFVGAILGGALAISISLIQFWQEPLIIILVLAIFIIGQIFEGNFLTPKLVGKSVGIHPVWLIFALALFGTYGGFVGLLFAVPVTAILGVIIRHYFKIYFASEFYTSKEP